MPSYRKEVQVPGRSASELYDFLNAEIDHFLQKNALTGYELKRTPEKRTFEVKHSWFSAQLVCSDGQLVLDGKLGLLAMPFRSKIDEGIEKWVKKKFQAS